MILPLALIVTHFSLSSSLECGSPGDSFHHESDCRSYYVCDNMKTPQLFTCQDGKHYDKIQRKCVVGDDEECTLNEGDSEDKDREKMTTMRDHAEPETPYKFTLDIKDLKKVIEKLGKPQNYNQEEGLKVEEEIGDKKTEHVVKRQIDEDDKDHRKKDDEVYESQNKEEMKKEVTDKEEERASQEPVEVSENKRPEENIPKENVENLPGDVAPIEQKELFPEHSVYPGLVALNLQAKGTQTIISYGYPDTIEQTENLETVEEVKQEEEQHAMVGQDNTEGKKLEGSNEQTVEDNRKVEDEADEGQKLESHDDENPVQDEEHDHNKEVHEQVQEGKEVDESIVRDDDATNSSNHEQVGKSDQPEVNKDKRAKE